MKSPFFFLLVSGFCAALLSLPGCKKDDAGCASCDCENFPPPTGERWTYKVIGNGYQFSIMTEPVTELVGGKKVYRWRRSDSPQNLGDYIGCDKKHGKVWVATESWNVFPPYDPQRKVFAEPIPIDLCPFGTPVGTVKHDGDFRGYADRQEVEVVSYESVSVPYGTFQNAQKLKTTLYDNGQVDQNSHPFYSWVVKDLGTVKELYVTPNPEVGLELIAYKKP